MRWEGAGAEVTESHRRQGSERERERDGGRERVIERESPASDKAQTQRDKAQTQRADDLDRFGLCAMMGMNSDDDDGGVEVEC